MTDTPTIALYYREHDPLKRKMFLEQSIAAGEDEEANAIRKELWELRYQGRTESGLGYSRQTDIWLSGWRWNLTKVHRKIFRCEGSAQGDRKESGETEIQRVSGEK